MPAGKEIVPAASVLAGIAVGLRTFSAPAALGLRGERAGARLLPAAALAEMVVDKLPATPSRLEPAGLLARALSSLVCGTRLGGPRGAAPAVLCAVLSATAGHAVRRASPGRRTALAEDLLAAALAAAAIRAARTHR